MSAREGGNIRTVLFDYGGVIADEGFHQGLLAIARLNGLWPDAFYDYVRRLIADCGYLTGRADEALFWAGVRKEFGIKQTDGQLRREILDRFVLRPGMLDAVARLRGAGVQVGLISDQTNWLDELDRRDGLFSRFDRVFNSYHEGASKYDGGLFQTVTDKLGTAPRDILIVDDNAGNIQKARQEGFQALLFENEEQFRREMKLLLPGIFN